MERPESELRYWNSLISVVDAFELAGVGVWLEQGTLLGFVREGWFLKGDNDIDLAAKGADVWSKRSQLYRAFARKGIQITITVNDVLIVIPNMDLPIAVHLYWESGKELIRNTVPSTQFRNSSVLIQPILLLCSFVIFTVISNVFTRTKPFSRLRAYNAILKITFPLVWVLSPIFKNQRFLKWYAVHTIHNSIGTQFVIPKDIVSPIKKLKKRDKELPIPNEEGLYLEQYYGPGWTTPDPQFDTKNYYNKRSTS
ncbi:MAG: hypothetical protein ACMXYM_02455 [Candidatus Woesearchaeota archaeon]